MVERGNFLLQCNRSRRMTESSLRLRACSLPWTTPRTATMSFTMPRSPRLLPTRRSKRKRTNYAYDVLIPALNQIIHRYKQQGRAAQYRLNGCPTVGEYFGSIGLNYSTVRSWKSRAQQRLLQAATDAGTKPAPGNTSDRDPVPHLNKAERTTLIEASHRAVEMVAAVEAGRDAKQEIAAFKVVMNAKRLDDIMQAQEREPDYKSILAKLVQTVADMKASLPAPFVKAVRELTKPCNFKAALPPGSNSMDEW